MIHPITLHMLAAALAGGEMNLVSTAAVTAVCSAITGVVLYSQGKKARTVTIDGKPSVRIEDEFVRRAELAEFKDEIRAKTQRIESCVDKLGDIMLARDEAMRRSLKETAESLSDKIERVASGAFESRRKIHETVNEQGKLIAAIGVNADVGKQIGKLGAAIMAHTKACPITQPTPPRQ